MAVPVVMPKQGQSVESCIISEIRKKGEKVSIGDILFVYETDKATFEEEAKAEGVILAVFFEEGDEVPVFSTVCVIGKEGEVVEEFFPGTALSTPASGKPDNEAIKVPSHNLANAVTSEIKIESVAVGDIPESQKSQNTGITEKSSSVAGISPRARMLADRKGVDTSKLNSTGPLSRIIERDVREAADILKISPLAHKIMKEDNSTVGTAGSGLAGTVKAEDLHAAADDVSSGFEIKPLTNIRKLIARAMCDSLQNSAQLTHHLGADARSIIRLRKKIKKSVEAGQAVDITLNDMICFATIRALKKFPQINTHFLDQSIKYFNNVHLGVAVDTDRGLMVPVIRNAEGMNISELSSKIKEMAAACRKGNIDPEFLSSEAASFTISNLGSYGVEMFTPVINLPQTGILGVNTTVLRPKDLGDCTIGFVPYLGLSLTYDHRAIDGGEATRFLKLVATEIENFNGEI